MKYKEIIICFVAVFGGVIVNSGYYHQPYNNTRYLQQRNVSNVQQPFGYRHPVQNNTYVTYYYPKYTKVPNFRNGSYNYGWNHSYANSTRFRRYSIGFPYPPPSSNNSHHLITGIPRFGDHLVFNKSIQDEPFTWWGKSTKYVFYPPKGITNTRNITVIQVFDLIRDGTGGWARIVYGGVGYRNVTLKLKGKTGNKMSFQVLVYTN